MILNMRQKGELYEYIPDKTMIEVHKPEEYNRKMDIK